MGYNQKRRKTAQQKRWEDRKLKMACVNIKEEHVISDDEDIQEIIYKDEFKNIINTTEPEQIFDFTNELFKIGQRKSAFYSKYIKECVNINYKPGNTLKCQQSDNSMRFEELPVYKHREDFMKIFSDSQNIVISGETGCGKSTLIPKLIYDKHRCNICITQPRRINVKNLYKRLKDFYNDEVGYAIKYEHCITKNTKIKIVTEGVLLRELATDVNLSNYDMLIFDEAHERSLNFDILLGQAKQIQNKRPDLKIILMSATLQIDQFCKYLNCPSYVFTGNQFPVHIKYLDINADDYIEWIVKKIIDIHNKEEKRGDILVFLSGKEDITQVYKLLKYHKPKDDLFIIPLYSEILNDVYDEIFSIKSESRKCILSTNIAEASVTIPNIKYVVDSGFCKVSYYDYNKGNCLIKYPISKENAIQRTGRAGRVCEGYCYRMYTKYSYENDLSDHQYPEILTANISHTILTLLSINVTNIENFPFITRPPKNTVLAGIANLLKLEAIDFGLNITKIGYEIQNIGIDPILGKLILEGVKASCSYDAILLASILSLDCKDIFDYFKNLKDSRDYINCIDNSNEYISLINIFKWGMSRKDIAPMLMKKVNTICNNLVSKLQSLNYKLTYTGNINDALINTLFFNISVRDGKFYRHIGTNLKCKTYKYQTEARHILFYRMYNSTDGTIYMQLCCEVDVQKVLQYKKYFFITNNDENPEGKTIYDAFIDVYTRFSSETEEE